MAILVSDKIDFKTRIVISDQKGTFHNDKKGIHQQEITIISIYEHNKKSEKKNKGNNEKLKREIDNSFFFPFIFISWRLITLQYSAIKKNLFWRRKWQPTPVFLPGKIHGQRSLAG